MTSFIKKLMFLGFLLSFSHCGGTNTGNGVVTLNIEFQNNASMVSGESFKICITGINYIINGEQQINYDYMNSVVELGEQSRTSIDPFVYTQDSGTLSGFTLRINTKCDSATNFSVYVKNGNGTFFIEDYVIIEQALSETEGLSEIDATIDVTDLINALKAATSNSDVLNAFPH